MSEPRKKIFFRPNKDGPYEKDGKWYISGVASVSLGNKTLSWESGVAVVFYIDDRQITEKPLEIEDDQGHVKLPETEVTSSGTLISKVWGETAEHAWRFNVDAKKPAAAVDWNFEGVILPDGKYRYLIWGLDEHGHKIPGKRISIKNLETGTTTEIKAEKDGVAVFETAYDSSQDSVPLEISFPDDPLQPHTTFMHKER
jgi:hypothetical protein